MAAPGVLFIKVSNGPIGESTTRHLSEVMRVALAESIAPHVLAGAPIGTWAVEINVDAIFSVARPETNPKIINAMLKLESENAAAVARRAAADADEDDDADDPAPESKAAPAPTPPTTPEPPKEDDSAKK